MTGRRDGAVPVLRVDGGGSANNLLMQMQADQLQVPVERSGVTETTALGAAFLAGLGTGVWSSLDEIAATWRLDRRFEPEARDETEVVQHEFQRIREHGWIRSQEPRPKNPDPRKNDQRPDDDFAAEEIGEKGQGS